MEKIVMSQDMQVMPNNAVQSGRQQQPFRHHDQEESSSSTTTMAMMMIWDNVCPFGPTTSSPTSLSLAAIHSRHNSLNDHEYVRTSSCPEVPDSTESSSSRAYLHYARQVVSTNDVVVQQQSQESSSSTNSRRTTTTTLIPLCLDCNRRIVQQKDVTPFALLLNRGHDVGNQGLSSSSTAGEDIIVGSTTTSRCQDWSHEDDDDDYSVVKRDLSMNSCREDHDTQHPFDHHHQESLAENDLLVKHDYASMVHDSSSPVLEIDMDMLITGDASSSGVPNSHDNDNSSIDRSSLQGNHSGDESTDAAALFVDSCHVCRNTASGCHYGAIACEGCKGFFRRAVLQGRLDGCQCKHHDHHHHHHHHHQSRLPWKCKGILLNKSLEGKCEIYGVPEAARRKVCKACRLSRCLAVGMNPRSVNRTLVNKLSSPAVTVVSSSLSGHCQH